ncbi:MAG: imidazole glycerol phosphate synthase subunit HisH [Chloroflexota bacterium]
MVVVIDYGAGNLRSVVNAIAVLGYESRVTNDPAVVETATSVILPGVGAAADTMAGLKAKGLPEVICRYIAGGRPFLGVCIGLQVLFSGSEEGGWQDCLGVIPGKVERFPPGLKVPHMGWNQVRQLKNHSLFRDIPDSTNFYFVHSYFGVPEDKSIIAGVTEYGVSFPSVLVRGNLMATQFHPEKSGAAGLRLYDNFLALAGEQKR